MPLSYVGEFVCGHKPGRANQQTKKHHVSSPSKADMFWKILSSSGVMAGLFSKVTNLHDDMMMRGRQGQSNEMREKEKKKQEVTKEMFIRLEMEKEHGMRNSNTTNITGRERRSRGFKTEEKQGIMKVVYKEKDKIS